jgi:hypothetical protein
MEMTDKKDFGQRFEINGQFAGYLKPADDGRWEVRTRDGKAAGRYQTSEAAASKLKVLLERHGPGSES